MRPVLRHLFIDAHRRVCIAKARGEKLSLNLWIGLQPPSQMRPMIAAGYALPLTQEQPRVLNWYRFTPLGLSEYKRRFNTAPDYFSDKFAYWQEPA